MGETPREIEQHIHVARAELGDNLNELETRLRDATNWRTYVDRKPLTMVGVAVGSGILLAALIGGRRGPSRERVSAYANEFSSQRPRRERPSEHTDGEHLHHAGDKFGKIAGAIMGVAADRALQFFSGLVPGFGHNYERMERRAAGRSEPDDAASIH